jgi:hypothetical protein
MTNPSDASVDFVDCSSMSAADFESLVDSDFEVDPGYFGITSQGTPVRRSDAYPDGVQVRLRLVEVQRRQPASEWSRQDPFTLLFSGSHEVPLYSNSHVLIHETLGTLSLFLSPVNAFPGIHPEQHPEGRFYESIFC